MSYLINKLENRATQVNFIYHQRSKKTGAPKNYLLLKGFNKWNTGTNLEIHDLVLSGLASIQHFEENTIHCS